MDDIIQCRERGVGVGFRRGGVGSLSGILKRAPRLATHPDEFEPAFFFLLEEFLRLFDHFQEFGAGEFVWSAASAFLDGDNDGDLDLYVDNYMVSDPQVVPRRGSEAAIAAAERKIISFFPRVRVREFEEEEWAALPDVTALIFANINTPDDLARLEGSACE